MRSVSILAIVKPKPEPPDATAAAEAAVDPRGEGLEDAVQLLRRHAGAGVMDLDMRHFPRIAQHQTHTCPSPVNLMALPSRLMQICRRRFSSALTRLRHVALHLKLKLQPLGRRLQFEHVGQLSHATWRTAWASH